MKKKNKKFPFAWFLVIFAVLYMLIAVKPTKNAMQLVPQWTIDISTQHSVLTTGEDKPFKIGRQMGYYTSDGAISFIKSVEEKGIVSSDYMAIFSSDAQEIPVLGSDGILKTTVKAAGFPFFDEDRIFLFAPTGNAFSRFNDTGNLLWSYENYAPITAFYSNSSGLVVGYADGNITAFSLDGDILQSYYPGGSEYEIILGATISNSGRYTACISGIDSQRIVVSNIKENTDKIVFHEYIENFVQTQTLIQFSSNEQYVFANAKDSLIVVDLKDGVSKNIDIVGRIVAIKEVGNGSFFFALSKNRGVNTITIFNSDVYQVGTFSFDGNDAFIDSDLENIYIGYDSKISKLKILQEK